MARKRLISPDFFKHSELYEAEVTSALPLRLAFSGLWCQTDKRGVFRWRPRELKLEVMPYDEDLDFADVLETLASFDFVRRYTVAGKEYGYIPSFTKWQTFHRNESPSADPDPPAEITDGADPLQGRQPRAWVPREIRNAVMERDGHRCVECQSTKRLTLDHIVPYSRGGTNDAENLRVLCRTCNCRKGSKPLQPLATTSQQPATDATTPVAVAVAVAVTGTDTVSVAGTSGGATTLQPTDRAPVAMFRQQEDQLRAMAQPHEVLALDLLLDPLGKARYLAVAELYAIAQAMPGHEVRGKNTGRPAGPADVLRALSEMAAGGMAWNVPLFRGCVRRLVDRPPEPPTETEREAANHARQIATRAQVTIESPRDPAELEAMRAQREAAMAKFFELAGKPASRDANTAPSRPPAATRKPQSSGRGGEPAPVGDLVSGALGGLLA